MKIIKRKTVQYIIIICIIFLMFAGIGLYYGSCYIKNKLLLSGEGTATDIALLVKNNFQITDAEVVYMKSLSFNEMEIDPINMRLMNVGNGVSLNAAVKNVYLIAPLLSDEYRYCKDAEIADELGFETNEPLNGVWLLNGKINADGVFEAAQRDDIYRYTVLDQNQLHGMKQCQAFGTFSEDSWGRFITGYAPIYTVEGSFVGLLGIDMDPDAYQSNAEHMIKAIIIILSIITIIMTGVFIIFYIKYTKILEDQRRFQFFSEMSHEMRTPMNGILGLATLSKTETDITSLHHNAKLIEKSGLHMLNLINATLNYKNQNKNNTKADTDYIINMKDIKSHDFSSILYGKKILLCEDHPINAEITRGMVEKAGGKIEIARNGQIGLEMFAASHHRYYDAVLMDIRMPVMDGLEATKKIRLLNRDDAKTVPIIALTANSYEEDIQATKIAGMNAHLAKPVELQTFYETLLNEILLRQYRL